MSQLAMIRAHLEAGATITTMQAIHEYGCTRLAARIGDLRKEGLPIHTHRIPGAQYAVYQIAKESTE